jgi:hypothetical protein
MAARLEPVLPEIVFVGGCTLSLRSPTLADCAVHATWSRTDRQVFALSSSSTPGTAGRSALGLCGGMDEKFALVAKLLQ